MKNFLHEFWIFGLKQAWACLFGVSFLVLILLTKIWYPFESLARYDFLFLGALLIQASLLIFKLETWKEAKVIFLFHLVGTAMEFFKTSPEIGSWAYPEESFFRIGTVPLFTGFMYSAVGSYIARSRKVMKLNYQELPTMAYMIGFSVLIYLNFFTHHFIFDFRWVLFVLVAVIFWKTRAYYKVLERERSMPMLLAFFLIAFFIWLAENIGTMGRVWVYPNQQLGWEMVSIDKLGSWFLLIIISFVMVEWVYRKVNE